MKYAILGIGQVGLRHFEAFSKIKKLKLIGFVEKNIERANSFEKKFNVKQFKNLKDLLALKLDFIVLCLPHNQRINPIHDCIEKGVNILIEKPLVFNLRELKKLKPLLKKKNLIHSLSFVHRYREEVLLTNKMIQQNKLGKVKFISEMMLSYKNPLLPKWIDQKSLSGGGVLMYNAVHSIDKLIFLTKSKINKVFAQSNNINTSIEVEDTITVVLMFKNGVIANLIAVFTPYKTKARWETKIFGSSASIDLKIREGLTYQSKTLNKNYDYTEYYKKFGPNHNFYLQAKSFVKALSTKREPFVSIDEGIYSVKIVDAIYKSINLKKIITIK